MHVHIFVTGHPGLSVGSELVVPHIDVDCTVIEVDTFTFIMAKDPRWEIHVVGLNVNVGLSLFMSIKLLKLIASSHFGRVAQKGYDIMLSSNVMYC